MAACIFLPVGIAAGAILKGRKKNVYMKCGMENFEYGRIQPEYENTHKRDTDEKEPAEIKKFSHIFEKIEEAVIDEVAAFSENGEEFPETGNTIRCE